MSSERWDRQAEMLANRVVKSARHLRRWARREQVRCYRLYDRDIPEVPLSIDWYDGRLYLARYRREDGPDEGEAWLERMAGAVAAALEVPPDSVHLRTRRRQRGKSQYERLAGPGDRAGERSFEVAEGGYRFRVNLTDYLDTGLFLHHRLTRARVGAEAAGARFLNLFCYTGAFTVYAAGGGARSTTSVDLSRRYTDWAHRNLELNRLAGPAHRVVRADVLAWLEEPAGDERFDLVVVDPPTFSNSKRMSGSFDVQRDHPDLLRRVLSLTAPGGAIYFATNRRRFHLRGEELGSRCERVEDVTDATTPPDFRRRRPHHCYRITAG